MSSDQKKPCKSCGFKETQCFYGSSSTSTLNNDQTFQVAGLFGNIIRLFQNL